MKKQCSITPGRFSRTRNLSRPQKHGSASISAEMSIGSGENTGITRHGYRFLNGKTALITGAATHRRGTGFKSGGKGVHVVLHSIVPVKSPCAGAGPFQIRAGPQVLCRPPCGGRCRRTHHGTSLARGQPAGHTHQQCLYFYGNGICRYDR